MHAYQYKTDVIGRPVIYDKEFIETERLALIEWTKKPNSIYFKSFALERGYSPKRLYEWAKINKDFSDTLDYVREWQESRIAIGACVGELNASFSKFFMSNICNWTEKSETKLSGDNANPLNFVLGISTGQNTLELCDESIHERAIEYSQGEAEQPLLASEQPVSYSGQEWAQDAFPPE